VERDEKSRVKRKLSIALVITALSFAAILKLGSVSFKDLFSANPYFILLAFLLHTTFWLFWTVRLKAIVRLLNHNIEFPRLFTGVLASNFVAGITPSSAGGEPIRIKVLSDSGMSVGEATASVMLERFLDAVFFSFFLLIMLSISGFAVGLGVKLGVIFTTLLVLLIVFLYELFKSPERVEKMLKIIEKRVKREFFTKIELEIWSFRNSFRSFIKNKFKAIQLIVLTALIWIPEFLVPSFILMAFSCQPHWILSLTSQAILVIASLAPLTPGSSGIAEFGFYYLYSTFANCKIGAVAGVWRVITYVSNLVAGILASFLYLKDQF